jgi:hypothetical protein
LIRPDALPVGRPLGPAVGPTRFVAPRDTLPPTGAAAVSCPAVPELTGLYTAAPEKRLYRH